MEMLNQYNVAVVGAGSAGCFFALEAVRLGLTVIVLDNKKRSSFGHPWADDVEKSVFARVGLPFPAPDLWQHQVAPSVLMAPDNSFRCFFGSADVVALAQDRFVQYLADLAEKAGAHILDQTLVTDLSFENNEPRELHVKQGQENLTIKADLFIDASGFQGVLRKHPGFEGRHDDKMTDREICTAFRGFIRPGKQKILDFARKHDFRDRTNYSTLLTKGGFSLRNILLDFEQGTLDILIGFKKSAGGLAGQDVKAFLEAEGFADEGIHGGGGFIPIRQALDHLVNNRFMIIGDAACQVICAHGSGVASSLIAAQLAAMTAHQAVRSGKLDREALWPYNCDYQRGRGALMAYYYASQLLTETLPKDDALWMISQGLFTASDFVRISQARPLNPLLGLPSRLKAFFKRPRFCLTFFRRAMHAQTLMNHYRRFPVSPY